MTSMPLPTQTPFLRPVPLNEKTMNLMGLSFFCNSMFEELYHMGAGGVISEKLKENCKRGVAEFHSLKWPYNKKPYPDIKTNFFDVISGLEVFEKMCNKYDKPLEQMADELISDLENIISDKPISQKYQTVEKLKKFFDEFGDYSHSAIREDSIPFY